MHFAEMLGLLTQTRQELSTGHFKDSLEIPLLIHGVEDSCESLLVLSERKKLRDCFVLSRTIFETIVNTCFLCIGDNGMLDRARRHSLQKSYRDLARESKIGDQIFKIKWGGTVKLEDNLALAKAVDEFTTKAGKEIVGWTPESLNERIKQIGDRYGNQITTQFQITLVSVYRHASEIAHGTVFGNMFATGLTAPGSETHIPQNYYKHVDQNLGMILGLLTISLGSLVEVLSVEASKPEATQKARIILDSLSASSRGKPLHVSG